MSSGHRDLRLAVYHGYEVVHTAESRAPYNVQSQRYAYEILDREGREILVFHWHPHGAGNVSTPHLHISGMRPIALPNRPDGTIPAPLDVSNAHLPTGRIVLEDVIGMLIRDIGVAPLEPAWESVLATNRGSIENR
jgi:hypothetical protein